MKTKHLLFAAALPLVFAACQNEEFDSANSPELSNDQRPLVEVNLDFQKGDAETRVSYDGEGYSWQATDKIGALLMDKFKSNNRPFGATAKDWEKETWYEHYELIDGIHTAYPFSWNETSKAWEAPSKLQEGNYFFAAPYDSYEGERQLVHNLDSQMQIGGTEKDMNKAISDNQYFIGYAQIKAGAENKEALKSVIMTPVLAPIKVTLRNIGTVAKDLEKVVIYGDQVATSLTINPTDAKYGGTNEDGAIVNTQKYNLNNNGSSSEGATDIFNYANLIGATEDEYKLGTDVLVYNIASGATDYKQGDALRQIVHPIYSVEEAANAPAYEKQAVLSFEEPVNVASKGEIHFAVMVNTIPVVEGTSANPGEENKGLRMELIFTQGRITTIDLTKINEDENVAGGLKPNTVLTNIEINSLKPSTKNELIVQFDNNSVVKAQTMSVQDATELLAFINWNAENARTNTVTLLKDVEFTKEMYDAISAKSYKGELKVTTDNGAKLMVNDDVPTDVLNELEKTTDATIVLNGERELTRAIAEKLNADKSTSLTIENQGTLTVKEEVAAYAKLNNYGTIKVDETGKLQGTASGDKVYNYGVIENKGEISNVNNGVDEDFKGLIKTSGLRNHIQTNAMGATVQLTNIGDPVQMANANAGTIYFETAAGVKASELTGVKNKRSIGVTKLNVTGGTIDFDNTSNATVTELTINGTVSVEGWDNKSPRVSTYHKFTGVKKAEISGNVTFDNAGIEGSSNVLVNKDAKLTFNHEAKFNDITFVKGATVRVNESGVVEVTDVVWNNNNISNFGEFLYTNKNGEYNVIEGKDIKQKPATPQTTNVKLNVIINSGGVATTDAPTGDGNFTVTNLKALDTFMKDEAGGNLEWPANTTYTIEDVTISSAIALSSTAENESDYRYLKTYANGKTVKLGANLSGLTSSMGLVFGKLDVTAAATITGTTTNVVVLTVDKINLGDNLTVATSFIKLNEEGKKNIGTESITGNGTLTGKIVDSTETLQWNATKKAWEDLVIAVS